MEAVLHNARLLGLWVIIGALFLCFHIFMLKNIVRAKHLSWSQKAVAFVVPPSVPYWSWRTRQKKLVWGWLITCGAYIFVRWGLHSA